MRKGGKRRFLVPPSVGYVGPIKDGSPGPIPVGYGPRRQVEIRKTSDTFFFVSFSGSSGANTACYVGSGSSKCPLTLSRVNLHDELRHRSIGQSPAAPT